MEIYCPLKCLEIYNEEIEILQDVINTELMQYGELETKITSKEANHKKLRGRESKINMSSIIE